MAAKRFHIARPDQLQSLVKYTKDNACSVARTARIWEAAKRRKGETRWDNGVYAGFSGDKLVQFGTLKYNLALNWCEQHLRQVYD